MEKGMAIHSSTLAQRITWTEEPGEVTVHGVTRVGHDLVTKRPPKRMGTEKRGVSFDIGYGQ